MNKYALCESTMCVGLQAQAMAFRRSHWNIIFFQTNAWTKYALFEGTLSGGLQAEAIVFRRIFLKHYTHSNIRLNKVCALWKYTEWWASSRSNGSQNKFFKTLYTFKQTIEQNMRDVEVHWVVGFKEKG